MKQPLILFLTTLLFTAIQAVIPTPPPQNRNTTAPQNRNTPTPQNRNTTIPQNRNTTIPSQQNLNSTLSQNATDSNEEVVDEEERSEIMKEWETHMQNFIPDDMLTFEVPPKSEEIFFEDIKAPTQIRGAYFISYSAAEKLDFFVRTPTNKRLFARFNKREGVFSVNVTDLGEYQFVFSNIRSKEKKSVTFAIDVHNTTDLHLQQEDLNPVENSLENISSGIREYSNEQRFTSKKQTSQLESISNTQTKLMIFSISEILIVIVATAWQIYYIKKILDNKRIV